MRSSPKEWFEELHRAGATRTSTPVTEADNVQFTVATMNLLLHLDFAYAETTQFAVRL